MKDRLVYYDVLRGLAIILVVCIHSLNFSIDKSLNPFFLVFWRNLISFAVPLFIAISGFFVANKDFDKPGAYGGFLRKQVPRVLIPYLLWAAFYSLFLIKNGMPLMKVLVLLLTFRVAVPFYFIGLIIQFYFLAPLMHKMANRKGLFFAAIISGLFCVGISYLRFERHLNLPVIVYAGTFIPFLFFYVLGVFLGKGNEIIGKRWLAVIVAIGSLLLLLAESLYDFNRSQDFGSATSTVKLSSMFYAFCIIVMLFNKKNKLYKNSLLEYLGSLSFGIYFTHIFFLTKINVLIERGLSLEPLAFQLLLVCLTLTSCILFCTIMRMINRDLAVKYLGL